MISALAADVPFREAIEFFRRKVNLPTRSYTDLWEGQHARAFVVAGAQKTALIADFRGAVDRAIADGTTLQTFRADFRDIVQRHGWSYRGGEAWRSRIIFETNLRMAYAAGRWEQIQRTKTTRPYLRYVALRGGRRRPEHQRWHGTILPVDHPWWRTHYPPCGWHCRCTVVQLSQRDLERRGWKVADEPPPSLLVRHTINTPQGPVTIEVPEGIDPGFGYNVGEASVGRGEELLKLEAHGAWTPLDGLTSTARTTLPQLPVDQPAAQLGARATDEAGLRENLRSAIGGDSAVLVDPIDGRVQVTQAIVDHMIEAPKRQGSGPRFDGRDAFFPFIPEIVQQPAEIWVGWARSDVSGRVLPRRRYVKLLQLDKTRVVAIVADADGEQWSGFTFFRGDARALARLRDGLLVYRRGE